MNLNITNFNTCKIIFLFLLFGNGLSFSKLGFSALIRNASANNVFLSILQINEGPAQEYIGEILTASYASEKILSEFQKSSNKKIAYARIIEPSFEELANELKGVGQAIEPDSTLVVHLSAHSGRDDSSGQFFLKCSRSLVFESVDFLDSVFNFVNKLTSGRLILLMNTCYSSCLHEKLDKYLKSRQTSVSQVVLITSSEEVSATKAEVSVPNNFSVDIGSVVNDLSRVRSATTFETELAREIFNSNSSLKLSDLPSKFNDYDTNPERKSLGYYIRVSTFPSDLLNKEKIK